MLGAMGWKIIPALQDLPVLPRSARNIPRWVMSSVVLSRIDGLLNCIERRFELMEADLEAPRGRVNWTVYATEKVPRMQFMQAPCRSPSPSLPLQFAGIMPLPSIRCVPEFAVVRTCTLPAPKSF
jgi:hypothetical protein